jgi:uncharacterized protein YciI
MAIFAVYVRRGGVWDFAQPMEAQPQWDEHARFMERLVDDGTIVLGGPLAGERSVLHIVQAESEADVRTRLEADPWHRMGLLAVESITPWTVRLARDPRLLSRQAPAQPSG